MRYPFVVTLAASDDVTDVREHISFRGGVASTLMDHEWKVPPCFQGVVALSVTAHREDQQCRARDLRVALAREFHAQPEALLLLHLLPTLQPSASTILELTSTRGYRNFSLVGSMGDADAIPSHGIVLMRIMPTRTGLFAMAVRDEGCLALTALLKRAEAIRHHSSTIAHREAVAHAIDVQTEKLFDDLSGVVTGSASSSVNTSAVSAASTEASTSSIFQMERQHLVALRSARPSLDVLRAAKEMEEGLVRLLEQPPQDDALDELYAVIGASMELQCHVAARILAVSVSPEVDRIAESAVERLYCSPDAGYALVAVGYSSLANLRKDNLPEATLLAASMCSMAGGMSSTHAMDNAILAGTLGGMCALLDATETATELIAPSLLRCLALGHGAPRDVFVPPSLTALIRRVASRGSELEEIMAVARTQPQSPHEMFCEAVTSAALALVYPY